MAVDTIVTEHTEKTAQDVVAYYYKGEMSLNAFNRWFKEDGWELWDEHLFIKWVPCPGR